MIAELYGKSGELLLVSRTEWTPLGVRARYGLSSKRPRLGLPRGEFTNWEYLGLADRELSVEILGGFDGDCEGTVCIGLYVGSGARGKDVLSGTFGGIVGTVDEEPILRGPIGRLDGDAKGELCSA